MYVPLPPSAPTCCCRTWVISDPARWVGQGEALGPVGQAFGILLAEAPFSHSSAPCPQELLLAPALLEQLTCMPGSGAGPGPHCTPGSADSAAGDAGMRSAGQAAHVLTVSQGWLLGDQLDAARLPSR